jgi:two-component system phosphate regulon sensor histidine kinase PhoR
LEQVWVRTLVTLALLGVAAYVTSFILEANAGWLLFSGGLFALLAYHVKNLRLLLGWLRQPEAGDVPGSTGVWDDALALLHRRERRHAKERRHLERLLVRFRQASRALPGSVVVLDAANRIQWCNETAEKHFGIDGQTDLGQPITNLVRQPELVHYIGAGDYSKALQMRSTRDADLVLSVQIIPYDSSQKLLLAGDVTQTEKLDRIRRDFVANVSHELRTPLTVLVGFLETVRELKLDPQRSRDYLDMMADQSRRMQRLLDDLLMLSSIESAPELASDERIVMSRLLARIAADAEMLSAGRHRVILEAEGDYDLLGAESEIVSAFGNLVSNAIRYTPAGGDIRIVWSASGAGARFSVQDTGIGIAPEHISRLTERFYRVDRSRSRETGGTGLGLAIVKHALMRHQAQLDIESEPGSGSRFSARFPARRVVSAVQPSVGADA